MQIQWRFGIAFILTCFMTSMSLPDEPKKGSNDHPKPKEAVSPGRFCLNLYPPRLQAKVEAKERALKHARAKLPKGASFWVGDVFKTWNQNSTVTVSFRGGAKALHKKLAMVMSEWTEQGNLKLDFGLDNTTGEYRQWSPTDTAFKSNIRIGFDQNGYWSLVGRDSSDPSLIGPGEASMNLEGFVEDLPSDWAATARHEMGHALGFHHEHQNPRGGCDEEFRWNDAPDGTPGIYTTLGGPPNYWPKSQVDFNLRQLPNSDAYVASAHDPLSIMHYSFPSWMFVHGDHSHCFVPRNVTLSEQDRVGMKTTYPMSAASAKELANIRMEALRSLTTSPNLTLQQKKSFQLQLDD